MEYAGIIRDKALLRSMAKAAGDIAAMVQEGVGTAGDLLSAAEQKIYAIRQGRGSQEMATVGAVLNDVMEQLAKLTAGSEPPGLSTGLSAVDRKINGLNKSDLLLLAARPGMGKTSMAPVSYTHLDVYKRQPSYTPALWRPSQYSPCCGR